MGENTEIKCKQEKMAEWYIAIQEIAIELANEKEKTDKIYLQFTDAYEGDAKEEINMFLTSLSGNLGRLTSFYSKMASYISVTAQSFMASDTKMVENMKG